MTDNAAESCVLLPAAILAGHGEVVEWALEGMLGDCDCGASCWLRAAAKAGRLELLQELAARYPLNLWAQHGQPSALAHVAFGCPLAALQQYYEPWGTGLLEGPEQKLRLLLAAAASPTPDWAEKCCWLWARAAGALGSTVAVEFCLDQLPALLRQHAAAPVAAAWGVAAVDAVRRCCQETNGLASLPYLLLEDPAADLTQSVAERPFLFRDAASGGADLLVLRHFHEQLGAPIDLAAVAKGGSEEALSWAVAALEAAGQAPEPLSCSDVIRVLPNWAAADWLVRHGLAPPKQELLRHMLSDGGWDMDVSDLQWIVGVRGGQGQVHVQWTAELHAALVDMQESFDAITAHAKWLAVLVDKAAAEVQGGRTSAPAGA
ncbi:hypothetical protein HXX76_014612 [Chlamydomonas incerta]|uniref:Uncharacterized protein n=1 Tax=Chlamydomonas incerta TaxID=51695 RepID=A0A835SBU2_CHLIN|nr:hypothetical protein HXX76_014612 [Chlamydomonas incerta]|eukprot:KAG2424403.1 hypothetical protein HXX76_014612 [Chlamydomonas incerta]